MVVMDKCCCCSVQTACLIFGAFALLGSLLQLSKDGKEVAKNLSRDNHQRELEVYALYNEMIQIMDADMDEIRNFFKINFYLAIPDFLLCLAMIVECEVQYKIRLSSYGLKLMCPKWFIFKGTLCFIVF